MKALEKKKQCPKIDDVESGASQTSNLVHIRSHLRRIIKRLVLLKMLKSPNRRIEWLCELAHKYRKLLAIGGALDTAASSSRVCATSGEPPAPNVSVTDEPVMEAEKAALDKVAEPKSSTEASAEAASSELYEALSLKGLPQRIHLPARRVLCRPSNLRWVKPCCTRSCSETLEHVITIPYSECQKRHPVSNQNCNCFCQGGGQREIFVEFCPGSDECTELGLFYIPDPHPDPVLLCPEQICCMDPEIVCNGFRVVGLIQHIILAN